MTSDQPDAEKLFFGIAILLASYENKGLAGAEAGQNRPLFDFFRILLVASDEKQARSEVRRAGSADRQTPGVTHFPISVIGCVRWEGEPIY